MKVLTPNYVFEKENKAEKLINSCEKYFEEQLGACAQRIMESKVKIAALSGPSCSGKTTASNKLIEYFSEMGKKIHVVSIDNFYYDRDFLIRRAKERNEDIDFDSPDTINFEYLRSCFESIVRGEPTRLPVFDFKTGVAAESETLIPSCVDLILFEGIQAFYDEFSEIISDTEHVTVFISPESKIKVGGKIFRPQDIRLSRRIVRDSLYRNTDPSFTLKLWKRVRENEEKNIFPNKYKADIVIDSALAYEPCVIRKRLIDLLMTVSANDENYDTVEELIGKYYEVPMLPETMVPQGSVFKEFII